MEVPKNDMITNNFWYTHIQ